MGGSKLYDTDIVTWCEQQVTALRALAERHDLPNALDVDNVIEEIEGLARTEIKAVTSPIRLILSRLLKCAVAPTSLARRHWNVEMQSWHDDVLADYAPSMRQRIELDALWQRAVRDVRRSLGRQGDDLPRVVPNTCPLGLDELLTDRFDLEAAVARVRAAILSPP